MRIFLITTFLHNILISVNGCLEIIVFSRNARQRHHTMSVLVQTTVERLSLRQRKVEFLVLNIIPDEQLVVYRQIRILARFLKQLAAQQIVKTIINIVIYGLLKIVLNLLQIGVANFQQLKILIYHLLKIALIIKQLRHFDTEIITAFCQFPAFSINRLGIVVQTILDKSLRKFRYLLHIGA